jgi:thymidylate synthase
VTDPYFSATTLDDVLRLVIEATLLHGKSISPRRGSARELTGILVELTNPRARLSRTETRGKPFSCLGELCWYLSGTNTLEFIQYYIPKYEHSADKDIVPTGYGPRLLNWDGINQIANIIDLLRMYPESRRAVIQLLDATDLADDLVSSSRDIPCTCTLQFLVRAGKLQMLTNMRSNDLILGLPHDVFCFTMLQEIIARSLSVGLGTYKHAVGSLHLYDERSDEARRFLDEGWQPTDSAMPPMPREDPWPSIDFLLSSEAAIRTVGVSDIDQWKRVDSYWGDLILMLAVLRSRRDRDASMIRRLREQISARLYHPFVDKKLIELTAG